MDIDYEVTKTFPCEFSESLEAWQESLTVAEQNSQDHIDMRMKDNSRFTGKPLHRMHSQQCAHIRVPPAVSEGRYR
jgi:hypothetical protein